MSTGFSQSLNSGSPEETAALAARLGAVLVPGDVVLLDGPVGAGKTHFARALIQSRLARAGRMEDVPSPTFTLVQSYDDGTTEIWHADLYRLTSPDEIEELGLSEAFEQAICLVEWPDRLGSLRPERALFVEFTPGAQEDQRRIHLRAEDETWAKRLVGLLEAAS